MKSGYLVLLVGGFLSSPMSVQASLVNAGFETGNLSGWSVASTSGVYGVATDGIIIPGTNPSFGTTYVNVRNGSFAAYAAGDGSDALVLSQTVLLAPGTYDVGFYGGVDSPDQLYGYGSADTHIKIDGNSIPFTSYWNYPSNATFQLFAGQFFSTGGSVQIEFQLSGSGTGTAGFSFDDFFVTATVPEPGSLALAGLGLLGLGLTRRRAA